MATTLSTRTGAFLISEASGERSRDTLSAAEDVGPNTVVAARTAPAYSAAITQNAGANALYDAAVAAGAAPKTGEFRIVYANTGPDALTVVDPDGYRLEDVDASSPGPYERGGVQFDISTGDANVGDEFVITVSSAAGSGDIVEWDPNATDGSETPIGIAIYGASAGEAFAAITRDAEVLGSALTLPANSLDDATAGLAALGIVVR